MNVKILTILFILFFERTIYSQNVGINADGSTPNSSAMLDVDVTSLATKKGLLIPRLTLAEKTAMNPLPSVAQGLVIYQTTGIEGFYYNTSTTTAPNWVYLLPSTTSGAGWTTLGNLGTTASSSAYGSSVNNNFIGTTDNIDFVFATNNLERVRVSGGGLVGIGTNALANNKLEVVTANSALNAIYGSHSSVVAASVYSGVQGALTGAGLATTGSLAYHNSSDKRYAVYGSGGDLAGAFNGYVSINPVGTGLTTNDLEVRNTVGGNPVNVILRQTASQTTNATVLGNLFFGDNHQTTGQAQISVARGAAGGAGDLPTDMLFYTIPDASTTLTERMRILNTGQVGIGTSTSFSNSIIALKDGHIKITQTTAPTIAVSANAGTAGAAALSATSNDIIGQITLAEGTASWATGIQCTVTFNKPYSNPPIVLITPFNAAAASGSANQQVFVTSTTTTFSINFAGAAAGSANNWKWNYIVLEP
jgi:hypothetical protein